MKRLINYLLLIVLVLSALLPINVALASNTTLAEYIGTIRITNNSTSSATNVFTVFNLTTQDLIDGDFVFQNLTNSSMLTNGGADTEYMPAPGALNAWAVYVPSIIAKGVLDYKLHLGGVQDMEGQIRYFAHPVTGMITLDSATLEPGANLDTQANNWTIEQQGFVDTTVGAGKDLARKKAAFRTYVSAANNITSQIETVAAPALNTNYQPGGYVYEPVWGVNWFAQTFIPVTDNYITSIELYGYEAGAAVGNITVSIKLTDGGLPIGADLCSGTVVASTWPAIGGVGFNTIPIVDGTLLEAGTTYAIVMRVPDSNAGNHLAVAYVAVGAYADGQKADSNDSGDSWTGTVEDFAFRENGEAVTYSRATATGITSTNHTVRASLGIPILSPGNLLSFNQTATSDVDCDVIHNATAKAWFSIWFRLDNDFPSGANQYLFSKRIDGTHFIKLELLNADGKLEFLLFDGVAQFRIHAQNGGGDITSWNADQWYHILASVSDVAGARLIVDNGVVVTDADLSGYPNGGNFVIGDREVGVGSGIDGEIYFVAFGTDDLTTAEEYYLSQGYTVGDEVDLWYMDEGNGTAIKSYGSAGNDGTAGANTSWITGSVLRSFVISIDGTAEDGTHVLDVIDNDNDWDFLQNDSVPFLESQEITRHSVQQQFIEWENNETTFTDASGQGHDATPTFRNVTSNLDVTAELISFVPVAPAVASNFTISAPSDMIGPVVEPSELYNETVDTGIPGTPFVEDIMASAGIPAIMFYVPLLMLGLCIVGLVVGKFSLLAQLIIMSIIIFAAAGIGVPAWIGLIFLLDGLAFVLASKQFGW